MTDTARILQLVIEKLSARAGVLGCAGVKSEMVIGTALAEMSVCIAQALELSDAVDRLAAPTRPTRGEEAANTTAAELNEILTKTAAAMGHRVGSGLAYWETAERLLRVANLARNVRAKIQQLAGRTGSIAYYHRDLFEALRLLDGHAADISHPGADSQPPNIDALNRVARPEEPARVGPRVIDTIVAAGEATLQDASHVPPMRMLKDAEENFLAPHIHEWKRFGHVWECECGKQLRDGEYPEASGTAREAPSQASDSVSAYLVEEIRLAIGRGEEIPRFIRKAFDRLHSTGGAK